MKAGWIGCAAVLALAACGDPMGDYPSLMPTDQLLADPALPAHARDAANDPAATDAALQGRAAGLAGGAAGTAAGAGDLARRADALRARADALSRQSLDACPADDPACARPQPADE